MYGSRCLRLGGGARSMLSSGFPISEDWSSGAVRLAPARRACWLPVSITNASVRLRLACVFDNVVLSSLEVFLGHHSAAGVSPSPVILPIRGTVCRAPSERLELEAHRFGGRLPASESLRGSARAQ